jgi:putative NADH-flavin reductase
VKLVVFGATGRLGSRLVDEALARGHRVTAAVRDPTGFDAGDRDIDVFAADATDPVTVAVAAAGQDAALSAVTQHEAPEVLSEAARGLLEGVSRAGVKRLVVAGGAGSLEVAPGVRALDTPEFPEKSKPEATAQANALEVYRGADTDVAWSYISPAALLEPGERTGAYRVGGEQMLSDEEGKSRITMEDFAIAMLDEAEDQKHPRSRFTVAH